MAAASLAPALRRAQGERKFSPTELGDALAPKQKTPAGWGAPDGRSFSSPGNRSGGFAELVHCIVFAACFQSSLSGKIFLMIVTEIRA